VTHVIGEDLFGVPALLKVKKHVLCRMNHRNGGDDRLLVFFLGEGGALGFWRATVPQMLGCLLTQLRQLPPWVFNTHSEFLADRNVYLVALFFGTTFYEYGTKGPAFLDGEERSPFVVVVVLAHSNFSSLLMVCQRVDKARVDKIPRRPAKEAL